MKTSRNGLVSALVLLGGFAFASAASGKDDPKEPETPLLREVAFPRRGISLRVLSAWTIDQYGADLARWSADGVDVRLQVSREKEPTKATSDATETEGGARVRRRAGVTGTGHGFDLVATTSGEGTARADAEAAVDAALASVDVHPFPNPRIHADWKHGWTLEVPDDWDLTPASGAARFAPKAGGCVLAVDAWEDLAAAKGGPSIPRPLPTKVDGLMDLAVRLARQEKIGGEEIVGWEEAEVAEVGVGAGVDARLSGFKVQTKAMKEKGEHGWVSLVVTPKFRLMLVCDAAGSEASKAALAVFRSFEPDTVGAARTADPAKDSAPTDRFPGGKGPAVVFRLPAGWKTTPTTSAMRLAQYEIPGEPPIAVVVFFFGAGGGGGIEQNFDRWKEQVHGGPEPKVTVVEVAKDIRLHVLDAEGTYVASGMGGSGMPEHIADARMLGAVLECPGGPLFVKVVGPATAIAKHAATILDWLKSFRAAV